MVRAGGADVTAGDFSVDRDGPPPRPPGGPGPGAPGGADRYKARWDRAGWVELGEQQVLGRSDHDLIKVGRREGRFDRLMVVVEDSDLQMTSMRITFTNGDVLEPRIQHFFRENDRTRSIDLPGERRGVGIKQIEFHYGNLPGGGRAKVSVWGHEDSGPRPGGGGGPPPGRPLPRPQADRDRLLAAPGFGRHRGDHPGPSLRPRDAGPVRRSGRDAEPPRRQPPHLQGAATPRQGGRLAARERMARPAGGAVRRLGSERGPRARAPARGTPPGRPALVAGAPASDRQGRGRARGRLPRRGGPAGARARRAAKEARRRPAQALGQRLLAQEDVRVELALHAERSARLERMQRLAEAGDYGSLAVRIRMLMEYEDARHQQRMDDLKAAYARR